MTYLRIEAALLAYSRSPIEEPIESVMAKALAAADAAAWRPIAEYSPSMGQVYCGHSEKKWLRHGRMIPGHGTRWYYSGTNERSQWAQQEGDEPTHFRPLPAPPVQEVQE